MRPLTAGRRTQDPGERHLREVLDRIELHDAHDVRRMLPPRIAAAAAGLAEASAPARSTGEERVRRPTLSERRPETARLGPIARAVGESVKWPEFQTPVKIGQQLTGAASESIASRTSGPRTVRR